MTAIARVLTPAGFAIAADGRARDEKREVLSDRNQKIFPIEGKPLAYALSGALGIGNEGTPGYLVDVRSQIENGVRNLASGNVGDLVSYGERMARPVYQAALKAKTDGSLEKYPSRGPEPNQPGLTMFRIWLFGYLHGSPKAVIVRLFHRDQRLRKPESIQQSLEIGAVDVRGSWTVARLLYESDDPQFARFRRPLPETQEQFTLSEGIERVKSYIAACDSDEGRAVDPETCSGIGGRMHAATVTADGFRWVPGCEPVTDGD